MMAVEKSVDFFGLADDGPADDGPADDGPAEDGPAGSPPPFPAAIGLSSPSAMVLRRSERWSLREQALSATAVSAVGRQR